MHGDDKAGPVGEGVIGRPELRVVPLPEQPIGGLGSIALMPVMDGEKLAETGDSIGPDERGVSTGGAALHLAGSLDVTVSEGEGADAAQTDRSGRAAKPRNAIGLQDVTEETGVNPPGGKGRIDINGGRDAGSGLGGNKGSGSKLDTTQGGTENRRRTRNKAGKGGGTGAPDSVGQYLNEIGMVPLLDVDDERNLSQIIEKGREAQERIDAGDNSAANRRAVRSGARAKDRFIRANLRLVVSVARRYPLPPSMELLDLIQEGNLGLEHAVDKFEWRKGFKFSTYATFWIRQAIGRSLDQKASLIRLPGDRSAGLRAALRQVSGDGDELDDENARLHRLTTPTYLDRNLDDDPDSGELYDLIPDRGKGPEDEVMHKAEETMVTSLLDVLDPRAKYAVEQRFGLNDGRKRTYREVGEELGITAEAARRLVKRAISAVRDQAGDVLSDFDAV